MMLQNTLQNLALKLIQSQQKLIIGKELVNLI